MLNPCGSCEAGIPPNPSIASAEISHMQSRARRTATQMKAELGSVSFRGEDSCTWGIVPLQLYQMGVTFTLMLSYLQSSPERRVDPVAYLERRMKMYKCWLGF